MRISDAPFLNFMSTVLYLKALKSLPKNIIHPICTCSVYHVMQKYLTERGEVTFDKIFDQRLGELRFWPGCGKI